MRIRSSLVLPALLSALVAGGCRGSAGERRAGERATAEAEETASETTITNAVIAPLDDTRVTVSDAVREQRDEYRAKLQAALDALDAKRADAKRRGTAHLKLLEGRRDVLKHHLDALDRTTDQDWAALKAGIDRDLRESVISERQGR